MSLIEKYAKFEKIEKFEKSLNLMKNYQNHSDAEMEDFREFKRDILLTEVSRAETRLTVYRPSCVIKGECFAPYNFFKFPNFFIIFDHIKNNWGK